MKTLGPQRLGAGLMLLLILWLPGSGIGAGLIEGQTVPAFELSGLDGKTHSLDELTANGPTLIVFWSTHCHFCHAMIPDFKRIHAVYHDRGISFAAVNVGYEDKAEVRRYVKEHGLEYLVLNDDAKKVELAETYALIGTPTIVLVSDEHKVLYYGHTLPDLEPHVPAKAAAAR